ncbi:nitrous oxide reductase accessory protein NosL [Rossellomorea oryzaecorticis]|uniref:Nitrous oxide reductase accessory protein NosL n=1 Tax=Rossellomorea oryzaecorticis TaxID=1396505 RepID=A0ABU9K9X2_9BACI
MKKLLMAIIVLLFIFVVSACGSAGTGPVESKEKETGQQHEAKKDADGKLAEPGDDTVCAYCNMKVHTSDSDFGVFSAQAVKEDGSNVFFDDIGCMLNQERVDETVYAEKYVRDYETEEWIPLDDAHIVKAEIKTPMNYGYAFFAKKEEAEAFIGEQDDKASFAALDTIDEVASHRHMKKMERMKDGEGHHEMKKGESMEGESHHGEDDGSHGHDESDSNHSH